MQYSEFVGSVDAQQRYWARSYLGWRRIGQAKPNDGHRALADLQTIRERFGTLEGVRVAWVGDGTNVCVSLAEACALLGAELTCAATPGYEPSDPSIRVDRRNERRAPVEQAQLALLGRIGRRELHVAAAAQHERGDPVV